MSAHEKQSNAASESHKSVGIDKSSTGFAPNVIEERIKANLEPLHAQVSTLTQMMNQLIQGNSAKMNSTTGPRHCRFPSESLLIDDPGTFRTLSLTSLATAGYSPDRFTTFENSFCSKHLYCYSFKRTKITELKIRFDWNFSATNEFSNRP